MKTLLITSGKGGSGKTIASINLSLALNYLNHRVVLVDGNLKKPNISMHFDYPNDNTLHHVTKVNPVDMVKNHPSGLDIVHGSTHIDDSDNINHEDFSNIINYLQQNLNHDLMVIDSSSHISDELYNNVKLADETIVITKPDSIDVVNCHGHRGKINIDDIQRELRRPILGVIPDDKLIHKSLEIGHPLLVAFPNTKVSNAFVEIGKKYSLWNK